MEDIGIYVMTILKCILKDRRVRSSLYSGQSGDRLVPGFCEHGNELRIAQKVSTFLTN